MRKHLKAIFVIFTLFPILACTMSVNMTSTPVPALPTSEATESVSAPTKDITQNPIVEPTDPPASGTITVFFTDQARFAVGTEPYEVAVTRPLPDGADPVRAVLDALFAGPTPQETAQGLVLFSSGFTGVREYTLENGIARIHLEGKCANNGAAYSVASVIAKNLEQFPRITAFKIYDENNDNLDPDSTMSSVPYCLEP